MISKNTPQPKKRVLRQRKNHGGQSLVDRIQLVISYRKKEQTHDILFDEVYLTPQEMYSRGFLGDIELPRKEDAPIEATVEAGPIGEFNGNEVGNFVFRVYETQSLKPINAKVMAYSYRTR